MDHIAAKTMWHSYSCQKWPYCETHSCKNGHFMKHMVMALHGTSELPDNCTNTTTASKVVICEPLPLKYLVAISLFSTENFGTVG